MAYESVPAPRVWTAGGVDYRVNLLTATAYAELRQLVRDRARDPRERVKRLIEGLPAEVATHIWDKETAGLPPWPPEVDSPEGKEVVASPEGKALFVYHALRKHNAIDREKARAIAEALDDGEFAALLERVTPGADDPKAPPTGTTTVGTTTPPPDVP